MPRDAPGHRDGWNQRQGNCGHAHTPGEGAGLVAGRGSPCWSPQCPPPSSSRGSGLAQQGWGHAAWSGEAWARAYVPDSEFPGKCYYAFQRPSPRGWSRRVCTVSGRPLASSAARARVRLHPGWAGAPWRWAPCPFLYTDAAPGGSCVLSKQREISVCAAIVSRPWGGQSWAAEPAGRTSG